MNMSKMLRNARHRAGMMALIGLLGLARYCFDSALGGLEHWLGGVLDWPMHLKMPGIGVQNDAWRDRTSEGRKSRKIVVWQGLGGSWGTSWDSWSDFPEISAEVGAKMGEVGGKLRPRWAMIAPSWAKMAPRWPVSAQLGRSWSGFGSIFWWFGHMGWIAKNL